MTTFSNPSLSDTGLDADLLDLLIAEHQNAILPRLQRLWDYYRNDLEAPGEVPGSCAGERFDAGRPYRLSQERGLPPRFTQPAPAAAFTGTQRDIVIENDIAWRMHTMVDFMLGQPFALTSLAIDPARPDLPRHIEQLLAAIFTAHGGIAFFQDLALLGSIYGYADVLLRVDAQAKAPPRPGGGPHATNSTSFNPAELAPLFILETIEAPRAIPVLEPADYRKLDAYVLHYYQQLNEVQHDSRLAQAVPHTIARSIATPRRRTIECVEVWSPSAVVRFEDRRLVERLPNRLGRLPVVHIQNLPLPFFYEGLSDVEPLIPLQDELNIRLSDRANRVTFQSFKMYLGKGIENFNQRPVGPGQMWQTDNLQATIEEFGGDASCPSEDAHIEQLRDALDKTSGVTPIAAGLLRDKIGNLTSENALRVVLMGLLAKTERRRISYGAGIARLCELILHAADVMGVLPTRPQDRQVRLDWPSPLPENTQQRLEEARLKIDLGVPREQVLSELGYAPHSTCTA
ncbi:MAG: phage portal protein [Phycisphaeraceae bacterium]